MKHTFIKTHQKGMQGCVECGRHLVVYMDMCPWCELAEKNEELARFKEEAPPPVENEDYFDKRLRLELGFTPLWIAKLQKIIEETCKYCWEAPRGCTCMRDE